MSTLKKGQKVYLVAKHKFGKEIPITAVAKELFDRVVPELSEEDWFVYDSGWTLHDVPNQGSDLCLERHSHPDPGYMCTSVRNHR